MNLINEKKIFDEWSPRLTKKLEGISESTLTWLSKYCHYHTLTESANQTLSNLPGMGNIFAPNTLGGANSFHTGQVGSGDKFPSLLPLAIQTAGRTHGFDIVDVIPMPGPAFQMSYMDYVYAGGKLDSVEAPLLIKFDEPLGTYIEGNTYQVTGPGTLMDVIFVGLSRIDAQTIWKVDAILTSGATVSDAVSGGVSTIVDGAGTPVTQTILTNAELVKAGEDHIQGFVGAGYSNTDQFRSNTRDGIVTTSGMSRGVGESTPFNVQTLQTYTKHVEAKTIQVAAGVTWEQISDLGKSYGVDVVKMVENSLMNELTQHLNKEILDRCFALGWTNHNNFAKVENGGTSLNLNIGAATTNVTYTGMLNTPITMSNGVDVIVAGNYENSQTLQRKVFTRALAIGAIITQRGRRGPATFIVTNAQTAALLQDNKHFAASPMQNTLTQQNGSLYPLGSISGMMVYVDPTMSWGDTRMLIGRKGGNDEPGVKFMPYLMAESVHTIAEGTMSPKIAVKSRYALVDVGHHPETQYFTIKISLGQQLI